MKRISTLIFSFFLVLGALAAKTDPLVLPLTTSSPTEASTAAIPLLLLPGMDVEVDGSRLRIDRLDNAWNGRGTLYFPALDQKLTVVFKNLEVNAFGKLLKGNIRAWSQVQCEERGAISAAGQTLPLDLTPHLRSRLNYDLPQGSLLEMTDLEVTDQGTFVSLDFDTPTLIEDDVLSFSGQRLKVDVETFCFDNPRLDIVDGGGFIDDFEFPMRILAGDPSEDDEGSYVTFDCDGFKEFSLSAEYPFPRSQVVPTRNARDTVFARFRIQAARLGNFVAFATVTPFEIPGVEDMTFTIDSAYVDYSDAANPRGFAINPLTNEAPERSWKGLFLRRLQVTLPEAVGAFNGGEEITIGGENIVYSRGNGLSGGLFAYNLLDLSTGNLGGWGVSIDTLRTTLLRNSVGNFDLRGEVYIPVFDREDKIEYNALLGTDTAGQSSLTLVLNVAGEYAVPFLGGIGMKLFEGSRAGVRFGERGFEPYISASGEVNLTMSGSVGGIEIPSVNLPGLRFQDFKLNDTELSYTQAASVVTAGIDRMSFGVFDWGGVNLAAAQQAVDGTLDAINSLQTGGNSGDQEKKVNGKSISIEDISFETITVNGQEIKELKLHTRVNFTKGSGGIAGELKFGVQGEVDYAGLVSLTPWRALSFHALSFGSVDINARFGPVRFVGALNIFDEDPVHGKGWKGGLGTKIKMATKTIEVNAMGQFGTAPDGDFDYFFVDIRSEIRPGVPLGAIELIGLGGGLYYNMSKSVTTEVEFGGDTPPINSTPGQSFSGARYRPRNNLIGFALSSAVQLQSKPEVFSGDLEITFEFNQAPTLGLRRILFGGTGYFLNKDRENRRKAAIQAVLAMELNIEQAFLSANFAYEVRAPYDNPMLTGGGLSEEPQGSLLIDLDGDDAYVWNSHFYFGKPRRPADLNLNISGIGSISADAYVMIGADLPDPVPLREIHPRLAGFPDLSRSQGGSSIGIAFGAKLGSEGEVGAGPISLYWEVLMGMDASIRKFNDVMCINTGREIGMNGWHIKGRAYGYLNAGVKLHVRLNLGVMSIDKVVTLADLEVTASFVAELPNPIYFGGKVRVVGSALGFTVVKRIKIEIGEKCEIEGGLDPALAVANIQVINGIFPEENSEDAREFEIYENPVASFQYPLSTSSTAPYDISYALMIENDNGVTDGYFPYLLSADLRDSSGQIVPQSLEWNDDHSLVTLNRERVLVPNARYTLKVVVRWSYREGTGHWKDLKDNNGNYVDEIRNVAIQTGDFPTNIDLRMLEADRHFPGFSQRNWHRNFGPGEFYFAQSGMDELFDTRITKTIDDESREVECRYAVELTDLETGELKEIPITERPGDFQLERLTENIYSYVVPTNLEGDSASVTYTRQVLQSYNSRGVKYNAINDEGILEKGRMYRFAIKRIPIVDEDAQQNVSTTEQEVVAQAGSSGIIVTSTAVNITSQADPFLLPETIYEFVFRTSRYDNLQQKVEEMNFIAAKRGRPLKGIDDPVVDRVARDDIAGFPAKNEMTPTADDYRLFRINEGFDWWERQRLMSSFRMGDENGGRRPYEFTEHMKPALSRAGELQNIPLVWKRAFDGHGEWASLTFPREPEGQYPRLSQSEIDNGRASNYYLGNELAQDGNMTHPGKWDIAVVHKGRRKMTFQAACITMMARTFYSNAPYYGDEYARIRRNTHSNGGIAGLWSSSSTSYEYSIENFGEVNVIDWKPESISRDNWTSGYDRMVDKAIAGYSASGPSGIVIGGEGIEYELTEQGGISGFFRDDSSVERDFSYSRFQYTWKRMRHYSAPPEQDISLFKNAMNRHGAELHAFSGYSAPAIFYFKDNYSTLTGSFTTGSPSVEISLNDLMKVNAEE